MWHYFQSLINIHIIKRLFSYPNHKDQFCGNPQEEFYYVGKYKNNFKLKSESQKRYSSFLSKLFNHVRSMCIIKKMIFRTYKYLLLLQFNVDKLKRIHYFPTDFYRRQN